MAWLIGIFKNETAPFVMELPSHNVYAPTVALYVYDSAPNSCAGRGPSSSVAIVVWALAYFSHPASIGGEYEQARRGGKKPKRLAPAARHADPQRYGPDRRGEAL